MCARNVNDELYKKGDIDVITEVDHGAEVWYRVGSRGSINWINENDLELVEKAEDVKTKTEGEEMRKFKIGDKVRVTEQHVKNGWAYSFDEKRQVMTVKEVDGNIVVCDLDDKLWNYTTDEIELNDLHVESISKPKFKIGDKVKGVAWWSGLKHTGTIIEIDEDDKKFTYRIKSDTSGEPWLKNSTIEKLEEMNSYEKLLKFVKENNLTIEDLNDVAENLDELENLEFEIKDTKDLIEETEEELQRLYEELSDLEDERNELLK